MKDRRPNPKEFYDKVMPGKLGEDYERARWRATPLQSAQYEMTAQTIRQHILPVLTNATRILEIGPGPGTWTKILLEANPKAAFTLVDISATMLARAKAELAHNANVAFVESDLLNFSASEKFDGFFSSRAIEYMPDKAATSGTIAALLSSGAYGAIITKMPKPLFDHLRGRKSGVLHQSQIAPFALSKLLHSAGLRVKRVRMATATVPGVGSALLNRIAFQMLHRLPLVFPFTLFAESYCVVFEKP